MSKVTFEPGAGFLRPEACIETQIAQAKKSGAKVFTSETVLDINTDSGRRQSENRQGDLRSRQSHPHRGSVDREASAARICAVTLPSIARRCAGSRSSRTSSATRPSTSPYSSGSPATACKTCSTVSRAIDGPEGGLKVATERYENTVDPDAVPRDVSDESVAAMYSEYIAPRLPDVSSHCLRTATCLYTVTPDAKFVIDYADANQNVLFASACSGHGFKHSPAVGEALAQRALGLPTRVDLSPFAIHRLTSSRK